METQTGKIQFYNSERGFGFVRSHHNGEDFFFHISELPAEYQQRGIEEGTYVQFELGIRKGNQIARNIVVVGGAE